MLKNAYVWTSSALTRTSSPNLLDFIKTSNCPIHQASSNEWCQTPILYYEFEAANISG